MLKIMPLSLTVFIFATGPISALEKSTTIKALETIGQAVVCVYSEGNKNHSMLSEQLNNKLMSIEKKIRISAPSLQLTGNFRQQLCVTTTLVE